jgi:glycosyltransferase involved in cell wall biosynthesis
MNICFVTNGVLPVPAVKGGAVQNLVQVILDKNEAYQKLNITVLSIFDDGIESVAEQYANVSFVFVNPPLIVEIIDKVIFFLVDKCMNKKNIFSYRYIFRRLFFIHRCYIYLRKHDFDRIIFENNHSLFLLLKSNKLRKSISHNIYYHAHNQPYNDFLCKSQIISCGNYIVVSEYIRNAYLERYPAITSRFYVLKNAVNLELFARNMSSEERIAERRKYNLNESDTAVLFTGRISEEKGILELAKAFLQIDNPSLKLIVVGSNFFDTGVESLLNKRLRYLLQPCIDRVIFTGYIKYEEIWKLYHLADIGCFPSICNESALLTGIEAMAAGLPFITTNSGGIPEYARPECAFILERNADLIENIKKAIETLVREPALGKSMGEKGREISAEYNLDAYYWNFLSILS